MDDIKLKTSINFIFKITPCLLLMYFCMNQSYYLINNMAQVGTFVYIIYTLLRNDILVSIFLMLSNIIFSLYTNTGIQNEITYLQIFQMGTIYLFFMFISTQNVKLKKDIDRKDNMINKDYSTGLYNKRFLDKLMSTDLEPNKVDTNIIAIDIDDFNLLTLNYGYKNSEAILKKVAKIINKKIKNKGYGCRVFGEKFIIIIEKNNNFDIKKFASEIKVLIDSTNFYLDDSIVNICTNIIITSSNNYMNSEDYLNHTIRMLDNSKFNFRDEIVEARKISL